jgi:hypothetical protein
MLQNIQFENIDEYFTLGALKVNRHKHPLLSEHNCATQLKCKPLDACRKMEKYIEIAA